MKLEFPINFQLNTWYRGNKIIKVQQSNKYCIIMTNNDKFIQKDNNIILNRQLLTNIPNLTSEELVNIYKYNLIKRGYKILN